MDSELKEYLKRMEERIIGMEERIIGMEERIIAMEERIMQRIDGRIDASEERLKDFIRKADFDLETKIVGEFWKWARTSDTRTRQALENVSAFGERLLNVEDRITALERKGLA